MFNETQVMDICKKYIAGATLKELATEFNCSAPTISKTLKDNNVSTRPKGRKKKEVPKTTYQDVAEADFKPQTAEARENDDRPWEVLNI